MYILHYAAVTVCTIFVLQLSLSKGGRLRKDKDLHDFLCPKVVAIRCLRETETDRQTDRESHDFLNPKVIAIRSHRET